MASYTDSNYCGANASYGLSKCKWKPRKVSAKRDFPDAFYDVINESKNQSFQFLKKHKAREFPEGSADKGMLDFIPLGTESVCSESCSSEPGVSDHDIIPRIVNIKTRVSDTSDDGDGDEIAESGAYDIIPRFVKAEMHGLDYDIIPQMVNTETRGSDSGPYTELKIHGVCLKEIKCYQTKEGLKIELSVNKCVKSYKQVGSCKRIRASAVRSYPLGCGPDAASSCG